MKGLVMTVHHDRYRCDRIVLAHDGSLAIQDLAGPRQRPRSPPPHLMAELGEHADEIGRWLHERGTI
jgi:hypothetical protein